MPSRELLAQSHNGAFDCAAQAATRHLPRMRRRHVVTDAEPRVHSRNHTEPRVYSRNHTPIGAMTRLKPRLGSCRECGTFSNRLAHHAQKMIPIPGHALAYSADVASPLLSHHVDDPRTAAPH